MRPTLLRFIAASTWLALALAACCDPFARTAQGAAWLAVAFLSLSAAATASLGAETPARPPAPRGDALPMRVAVALRAAERARRGRV